MSIVKRLTKLSSIIMFLPAAAMAGNNLSSLNQEEATKAFSNKTITTVSAATLNNEVIPNKFTGYFSNDGKMTGKFENKPKDQPQEDRGTWSIKPDGSLCFKWDHWDSGQEKCVSLYKLQNGVLIVNTQNGFESFILHRDIKSGNHMAR